VATGGIDLFFHEYLKPWDLAAGSLIVQEAGGFTCHINGKEIHNEIISSLLSLQMAK